MKKIILCAVAALAFAACNDNPVQEAVNLINKTTEKVEKAKNIDDINRATEELSEGMRELHDKYPDYQQTEDDEKRILEAGEKMQKALLDKSSMIMDQYAEPATPAAPADVMSESSDED